MLRRSYLTVAAVAALVLALGACGEGVPTPEAIQPTATPADTPVPTLIPTTAVATPQALEPTPTPPPSPSPTPTASPTPSTALNGGPPPADQVSLEPAQEELPTVEVVKILTPSVVQIVTEFLAMGFFNEPIPRSGVGTGVILDEDGHILTNNHVIASAQSITVTLSNGDSFPAEVIGGDSNTDTAVIRIDTDGLTPAKLGNSSDVRVGEDVIAIGHALGLPGGPTVSKGVVSALGRSIDADQQTTIVDLIQTDASINPGNSGGPLVNSRAEVIGINTAIIQGGRGIGFAINIDDAEVVASQLIERGYVERGFLGITPFNLTPGLADRLGVPATAGIIVARVIRDGAADDAGLLPEDVIVQLGNEPINNTGELSKFLIAHPPGETVDLVYFRQERKISTQVTLGERPQG